MAVLVLQKLDAQVLAAIKKDPAIQLAILNVGFNVDFLGLIDPVATGILGVGLQRLLTIPSYIKVLYVGTRDKTKDNWKDDPAFLAWWKTVEGQVGPGKPL